MLKKLPLIILLFFFVLFFPKNTLAVDVTITEHPSSISSDEFTVKVDIEYANTTNTINYLRVDLYKEGTSNYFGETFAGSSWYGGSDGVNYFQVEIKDGTASAQIKGKVGNPTVTEYPESGIYRLKIRRYTSSSSYTNSNVVETNITIDNSTPAPTPTEEPANTSAPIQTSTPTTTPKPTVLAKKTSRPRAISNGDGEDDEDLVIAMREELNGSEEDGENSEDEEKKKSSLPAILFVFIGVVFVGVAGYSFYLQKKKDTLNNDEKTEIEESS